MATSLGYTVLSILTSDASGKQYEVRRDTTGKRYCVDRTATAGAGKTVLCKSWQFNREEPKSCKHIKRYDADVANGEAIVAFADALPAVPVTANWPVRATVKPAPKPSKLDLDAVLRAMLDAGGLTVGSAPKARMKAVLAERLAPLMVFTFPVAPVAPAPEIQDGIRMITFTDD